MENPVEFQLLKQKAACEIVRSSQAAVAFSRAFLLEEVLIDKIGKEHRDLKDKYESFLRNVNDALKLDELPLPENALRSEFLRIRSESNEKHEIFGEFNNRILQAEARRQAKTSLLQRFSTNELMSKFESLTLIELRVLQVPEFSCFINDTDFGMFERLNEDWNFFREELTTLVNNGSIQLDLFRLNNEYETFSRRQASGLKPHPSASATVPRTNSVGGSILNGGGGGSSSNVRVEEIGKTFANRSDSLIRKFSTLIRRGKQRNGKSLSSESFEESSEL